MARAIKGHTINEIIPSDTSGEHQIYNINLLKQWRELESVMLATVDSKEDELGPGQPA